LDYRIVEILPERVRKLDPEKYVVGDAADLDVLTRAGILEAPTVIVTTHDDDLNVYLTIYCRRLRPDIQIIGRATRERIVATLHRAGADIVMSYASIGASSLMNLLRRGRILMVTEGLDVFRVNVPAALVDQRIADSAIRERTGCNVVAISTPEGERIVPGPEQVLPADAQLVLIGSIEEEEQFLEVFGGKDVRG
jgi:Trk K+ transport system NAD-binding subunit